MRNIRIYMQYTYIVGKYKIYLYELQKQAEQRAFGELFRPVSQRVQMNFIFNDNVRILCLSCNVKKVGKLVRFKQKGQKQASFLAFHKCCQGCLLRGPRYISTSCILVCTLCCTQLQGTRKVYSQAEKFIRLVRIKQIFFRIAYLYSKCTDCRIIHYTSYIDTVNVVYTNTALIMLSLLLQQLTLCRESRSFPLNYCAILHVDENLYIFLMCFFPIYMYGMLVLAI